MTELIRADPVLLDSFTASATTAIGQRDTEVSTYQEAWAALSGATFVPPVTVPGHKGADIATLLTSLRDLDGGPAVLAEALRTLDEDGDGDLDDADCILLKDHPELAPMLLPGGEVVGDDAVQTVIDEFDMFDTAGEGGDPDGRVSRADLEAVANDPCASPEAQAAAQYLLDNEGLWDLAETAADVRGPMATDGRATKEDLQSFLETNRHLRALEGYEDAIDTAAEGGDPDGHVSSEDLEAAAADETLPDEVREAIQHLIDDPAAQAALYHSPDLGLYHDFTFREVVVGRLVNGHAYAGDPAASADFVAGLPVPEDGGEGLPIELVSDDGFEALANDALTAADGDLTDTQAVIAHLPETTSGRRNELITAFYDLTAQRADAIFATAAGATPGDPTSAGHPGVNWLMFAPWASQGVHDVIAGDMRVVGFIAPDMHARQGAADGNQWIFDDITGRYAAFVELYEQTSGQPSAAQLETFFADNFEEGDLEIRQGFQAYVAALNEDDPATRQQLMFQGNTLVATHEQAGADPYLSKVATGPDTIATEFIDVQMGAHMIEVNHDLPEVANEHNLVDDAPILSLDTGDATDGDFDGNGVTFRTGGIDTEGAIDLAPIGGWSDEFDTSTTTWWETRGHGTEWTPTYSPHGPGAVPVPVEIDPDQTLEGTAAGSWPDYNDRMWSIHRMFEQMHTDPSLYDTAALRDGLDLDWLDPDVADSVHR